MILIYYIPAMILINRAYDKLGDLSDNEDGLSIFSFGTFMSDALMME
jgi:hypothetical protein